MPTNDHAVAMAVDLAACLVGCRIRSQEAYRAHLASVKPPAVEPRTAPFIFREEEDCREDCLTEFGEGLACAACVRHIEARECVYGRDERCRWSVDGHDLVLPCCVRDGATDSEPRDVAGASSCPASGICS
jgi:hypothetical protein